MSGCLNVLCSNPDTANKRLYNKAARFPRLCVDFVGVRGRYIHIFYSFVFICTVRLQSVKLYEPRGLANSASEMTYIVSGGALNSTHPLTLLVAND